MANKPKTRKAEMVHWHPNFRNAEELPDIKPVRTYFILNSVSALFLAVALGFFSVQEYACMALKNEIAELKKEIEPQKGKNKKLLEQSKQFLKLKKNIEELRRFLKQPVPVVQVMADLPGVVTKEIVLDTFRYFESRSGKDKKPVIELSGAVTGVSDSRAYELVYDFRKKLEKMPVIADIVETVEEKNVAWDAETEQLKFAFTIEIASQNPPKKKGEK